MTFFYRYKYFFLPIVVLLVLFFTPDTSFAFDLDDIPGVSFYKNLIETVQNTTSVFVGNIALGAVTGLVNIIIFLIRAILGTLLTLLGFLTGIALNLNMSILDFNPPFIIKGWQIFRDVANLGFVLGIIAIGVATILRIKNYQAQQILWKLIVAALVVNFSLVIAGSFIQASHVVSSYFISYIGGGSTDNIGTGIARISDTLELSQVDNEISKWGITEESAGESSVDNKISAQVTLIANSAVITIFMIAGFFIILSFTILLFLRYFYLSFLLIISPIAWLLWIFPDSEKYWKKWWSTFLHWVLYAPLILFFVYLALAVSDEYTEYAQGVDGKGLDVGIVLSSLMSMGLLIGGMKIAKSMGEEGASFALSMTDKASTWTKGKLKNRGMKIATKARTGVKELKERGKAKIFQSQKAKDLRENLADRHEKSLESGGIYKKIKGRGARRTSRYFLEKEMESQQHFSEKSIGEVEKQYRNANPEQITQLAKTAKNKEERFVFLKMLADKNKLSNVDIQSIGDKGLVEALEFGNKAGSGEDVSSIEKQLLKSLKMMKISLGEKVYKVDEKGEKKEVRQEDAYKEAQKDFHKGFKSEEDWKKIDPKIAKSVLFSQEHPLFDNREAEELHDFIMKNILDPFSGAFHGIASKLKSTEELFDFYDEVIRELREKMSSEDREKFNEELVKRGRTKAFEYLEDNSKDESIALMAKKLNRSISKKLGGDDTPKSKESKDKNKDKNKSKDKDS